MLIDCTMGGILAGSSDATCMVNCVPGNTTAAAQKAAAKHSPERAVLVIPLSQSTSRVFTASGPIHLDNRRMALCANVNRERGYDQVWSVAFGCS